ncbi:MAG: hypothetical protein RLZZ624_709 [Cyanobacteriota bacterium]
MTSTKPRRRVTASGSDGGLATPRPRQRDRRSLWRRKRWLVLALPLGVFGLLVALAPPSPEPASGTSTQVPVLRSAGDSFRYSEAPESFVLDFDPRRVQVDLFEGWDREREAYADSGALAFVSGPMYERHVTAGGQEITVPLGDLKLGRRVWRGRNRTASRQRAFIGIGHDGRVSFGFGELTAERARQFDTFIGGLHSIYNDLQTPPPAYKGAYSISMGQQIRYYLPRIRMLIGLRPDGRIEVLMTKDGLTLEQTRALARSRGLVAAYMPDHASKSRFIIPGSKGFNDQDANWISGGATSFVHVPYMLRLSLRPVPLQGQLLASLTPHRSGVGCGNPLQCSQAFGGALVDRALAGFNRLMEQGVEPLARLIWAPQQGPDPSRLALRSPLREPPITADPTALREIEEAIRRPDGNTNGLEPLPLPADLPAPLLLQDGQALPEASQPPALPADGLNGGSPSGSGGSAASAGVAVPPASGGAQAAPRPNVAPPPPQLPPPAP